MKLVALLAAPAALLATSLVIADQVPKTVKLACHVAFTAQEHGRAEAQRKIRSVRDHVG